MKPVNLTVGAMVSAMQENGNRYVPIMAYHDELNEEIVIPIGDIGEDVDEHNCDQQGCGLWHVVRYGFPPEGKK